MVVSFPLIPFTLYTHCAGPSTQVALEMIRLSLPVALQQGMTTDRARILCLQFLSEAAEFLLRPSASFEHFSKTLYKGRFAPLAKTQGWDCRLHTV